MGYYTKFKISFSEDIPDFEDKLEAASGYIFYNGKTEATWYNHQKDMLYLSKEYPEVLFTLEGEGEESGDLWIKYYKNGKYQESKVVITFEPFDENKLK